ncbi:MAG: YitT family protein [Ruminococcaceae bacterium]|nr:YitT family protein [Oscillospiraceae bacterium]
MIKRAIKDYTIITFGTILAAAAIYFFMLPSNLAVGSGTALAMVLSNFIPLPISLISLAINVILLILGFLLIGPEFGAKTVYTAVMLPVVLGAFEFFFPNFKSLTEDPLLDMICYILVVGIAMAILFSYNASSGGLDIVAKIMSKYLRMGLGTAVSVSGIIVSLTSILCYDTKTVVLSVLGTYFGGMIVDKFIFGLNIKRRVCVISPEIDKIVDFLLHELHSGATLYEGIGAYDGTVRREVVTIVDKNEYRLLMDYVKKVDPKAFVTVYSVNEMRYQPKVKKDGK